jgi:hypothetical protein
MERRCDCAYFSDEAGSSKAARPESVEDTMTRSSYEISSRTALIDAARTALGEQLPRHVPALHEPPAEIRQLLASLVALDSAKRRDARREAAASLPLELPQWPRW